MSVNHSVLPISLKEIKKNHFYTLDYTGDYRLDTFMQTGADSDRSLSRFLAEELLGGIPTANRTAEWYFLKGCIFYSKGWIEEATNYFGQAVSRDPSNQEYAAAYNQLFFRRRTGVSGMDGMPQTVQCTACDMCTGMMCMNCLCNGCCR